MKRLILSMILMLFLLPLLTVAETAEEKGLAIAQEADRRDTGFGDFTAEMLMLLKKENRI